MKASEKRILAKIRNDHELAKTKEELISTIQKSENSKRISWAKAKKEIASWK